MYRTPIYKISWVFNVQNSYLQDKLTQFVLHTYDLRKWTKFYSKMRLSKLNISALELEPIFYSEIKHGYRCFIFLATPGYERYSSHISLANLTQTAVL